MPKLSAHISASTTKMLLIGDSGAGKTGSLVSLAKAGYNLRILDLDNGLDIVANLLRADTVAADRVEFETLTDKMRPVGNKLIPAKATVWERAIKMLESWKTSDGRELGPVTSWGSKDVLVIDGLTMIAQAAMDFVLSMNARLGQKPHQSDWFDAQLMLEGLLRMLYDENVKCNVIVISHITYIGEDNGPQHGYPSSLGKALSPKIGRYFNSALMVKSTGAGANFKRQIHTNTVGLVELKNSNPLRVKPSYPIETGLADYFKDVQAEGP